MEWLGDVPEHWYIFKSNKIFKQSNVRSYESDEQLTASQKYGVIPQSLYMKKEESKVVLALSGIDNFKHVDKNDFVISLRSFQGGIELCFYDGCVSPAYTVLKPNKVINYSFWSYLFKSTIYISVLNTAVDGIREGKTISYTNFGKIYINIPPLSEQAQIANYLDTETTRIDNLIAKQEKLIELLEEQRKSIISHAVTKGLNPNAPMKDSGVEWLGEVPEHWEQKPIWSMFARTKRTNHPNELLLSVYRDYGVIPKNSRDDNHNRASEDLTPYQLVNPNDLVINKMKAWQGSIAISEHRGIVSPAYYIYEPKKPYYSKYIHHLIRSVYFIQSYKNFSKGIRVNQWDLEHDAFTHINLLLPPLTEQQKIVSFLDSETSRIDNLIAKQEKLIEKLKEYRSSIISHAVTGKIDVREFGA